MLKSYILLIAIAYGLTPKSYAQLSSVAGMSAASNGLVEVANLQCMGAPCVAEGKSFLLPFTIEFEADATMVDMANIEIYLTNIVNQQFNEKLKAYDYQGGVKIFGVQSESLGAGNNTTKLLSINVIKTEFVQYLDLSADGKKRVVFNIYGSFGVAKLQSQFQTLSPEIIAEIENYFGMTPTSTDMNTDFGTKLDLGASITFQINNLEIGGYARVLPHRSNSILGSKLDANALSNNTSFNAIQLGIDLQYVIYSGKRGDLFLFSTLEYGSYSNSMSVGQSNLSHIVKPPTTKEFVFKAGLRYTLPTFRKRKFAV